MGLKANWLANSDFRTTCSTNHEACYSALLFCRSENETRRLTESISTCIETISQCKAMGDCSLIIPNSKMCFYGPRKALKKCSIKQRNYYKVIESTYPQFP